MNLFAWQPQLSKSDFLGGQSRLTFCLPLQSCRQSEARSCIRYFIPSSASEFVPGKPGRIVPAVLLPEKTSSKPNGKRSKARPKKAEAKPEPEPDSNEYTELISLKERRDRSASDQASTSGRNSSSSTENESERPTELIFNLEWRGYGWGEEILPHVIVEQRVIQPCKRNRGSGPEPWTVRSFLYSPFVSFFPTYRLSPTAGLYGSPHFRSF